MPKRFLKFSDRWMFNRVLCEKEVCRKVLRAALGIEVGEITYLNAEQAKEPAAASRGVRMDVFAREGSRVFDIEMQVSPEDRIGRRMRYYQAAIDATELGPGEDYGLLPESFVVFFCATDPFRAGEAVYSIERVCLEAPELVAGDDSHWRVFNASAAEDVADPDLRDVSATAKSAERATLSRRRRPRFPAGGATALWPPALPRAAAQGALDRGVVEVRGPDLNLQRRGALGVPGRDRPARDLPSAELREPDRHRDVLCAERGQPPRGVRGPHDCPLSGSPSPSAASASRSFMR